MPGIVESTAERHIKKAGASYQAKVLRKAASMYALTKKDGVELQDPVEYLMQLANQLDERGEPL